MATVKQANYPAEAVEALREGYDPTATQEERDVQVANLAANLGKSVPSIRQKLQVMKLYVAKTYKTKTGNPVESKGSIVDSIAAACGVDDESLLSLSKGTKAALNIVRDTLSDFMTMIEAEQGEDQEVESDAEIA